MSQSFVPYDAACVDCRREAGKDPAGVTTQCIGHVYLERDALRQQLRDEQDKVLALAEALTAARQQLAAEMANPSRILMDWEMEIASLTNTLAVVRAELATERQKRCGTCADWQDNVTIASWAVGKFACCTSRQSYCQRAVNGDGSPCPWPADHGCPQHRAMEAK